MTSRENLRRASTHFGRAESQRGSLPNKALQRTRRELRAAERQRSVPEAQRSEQYLTVLDMSVTRAGLPPRLSGGGPRRERSGWEDTAMRLKPQ
jgi:hypothetical protein